MEEGRGETDKDDFVLQLSYPTITFLLWEGVKFWNESQLEVLI